MAIFIFIFIASIIVSLLTTTQNVTYGYGIYYLELVIKFFLSLLLSLFIVYLLRGRSFFRRIKKYSFWILIICLFVFLAPLLLTRSIDFLTNVKLAPKLDSDIEDISDEFLIIPEEKYSLSNSDFVISDDLITYPGLPERIKIKAKVNNSFSKPLWAKGKDCNYHGVLEKKTIIGWIIKNEEICREENSLVPGRFFNNGYSELHHVIPIDGAKGTYRIRMNLLSGCKGSKNSEGNILYGDCQGELVSYSPVFKIVE